MICSYTYLLATIISHTQQLSTFFCQRVQWQESVVGRLPGRPVALDDVSERMVVLLCTPQSDNMVYTTCHTVTMC